jgi:hypothetical protein
LRQYQHGITQLCEGVVILVEDTQTLTHWIIEGFAKEQVFEGVRFAHDGVASHLVLNVLQPTCFYLSFQSY